MRALVVKFVLIVLVVVAGASICPRAEAQFSDRDFCERRFNVQRQEIHSSRVLGLFIANKPSLTFEGLYRNVNGDRWTSCACFVETGCDCCKVDAVAYCAYTESLTRTTNNRIYAGCAWERG